MKLAIHKWTESEKRETQAQLQLQENLQQSHVRRRIEIGSRGKTLRQRPQVEEGLSGYPADELGNADQDRLRCLREAMRRRQMQERGARS